MFLFCILIIIISYFSDVRIV